MSSNDHTNCCSKFSASQISGGDLIKRNSTNHLSGQAIWKRLHESQTCINFPGTLDQVRFTFSNFFFNESNVGEATSEC